MEKIYALIKHGTVVNTIVADEEFISSVQEHYDACIRIDGCDPRPQIGDLYHADSSNFETAFELIEVRDNQVISIMQLEE